MIASAPDQVIAVRLTADRPGGSRSPPPSTARSARRSPAPTAATIALDGDLRRPARASPARSSSSALARAVADGGTVTQLRRHSPGADANSVTVLISIGTSYVNYRNVNGDYQGIARGHLDRRDAPVLRRPARSRHVADYQRLFGRTVIDLGRTAAADQPTDARIAQHDSGDDPQFSALLFQYGRYLLISSSRPGTQPANLQGIWNDSLSPSVGLEVHAQRQPADELLAGRHHQPGRVLRAGVRHDRRPRGHRRPHGRRCSTAPAAGSRTTTPTAGAGRRWSTAPAGACGRPAGRGWRP